MPIHVSDQQLDEVESGREAAVIVRSDRTKKGYALIPQKLYDQVRPFLQYVASRQETLSRERSPAPVIDWTPEKNARRVALINKKHDKRLTPSEQKELIQLKAEADKHRHADIQPQNDILELIFAGLQRQTSKPSK